MAWTDLVHFGLLAMIPLLSVLLYRRFPIALQPASTTTSLRDARTYRIQGIPNSWHKDQLRDFLADHDGCHEPIIKSLALEAHGRSQTGTVTFRGRTLPPKTLEGRLQNSSENTTVTLDIGFLGLSTLFAPPQEDHHVDIVAISGLGGHAFGSFKERNGQHMWLRDSLPYHLLREHTERPMARVMTYGYESTVANSSNIQNLEDLATSFRESLSVLASSQRAKPLVLVAHSLGGLIVKQALMALARSKQEDHMKIIRAVYGIAFFGVPHDGMDIRSLIAMVGDGQNRELIHSLDQTNSQILSIQQRDFHKALGPEGHTEVFCFYETMESPTAQQDENGRWSMTGRKAVLVAKSSATHCRPWENGPEHICAINRSHSDMVKFGHEDHEYQHTLQRLRGLSNRALCVRSRLRHENTKFLIPYDRNPDYVGRSSILETIRETFGFSKSKAARQPRVSLFGLGGVGKTQIALAFTYWIYENLLDTSVFWVHASNTDRFRQAFTSIAEECQVPGHNDPQSDIPMLVRKWLESKDRGRWVMIIDNADDKELFFPSKSNTADTPAIASTRPSYRLSDYLPDCTHGSILITTRDKKTGVKFSQSKLSVIEVDRLSECEAGQLLHKTLGEGVSAEEAACLSVRLEHLPLAIVQAAAFIQENSISINEYVQLLDENEDTFVEQLNESFETVGRDSDTPNAVTATWIISFNQIQRRDTLASEILSFISILDRQAIPKGFMMGYCDERYESVQRISKAEVTKALGTLKAFSLVAEAKDNTIDMHRLVQLVTRKWLMMQGKFAEFSECALKTVSKAYPSGDHESRQTCVDYLPHATAVLRINGTGSYSEQVERATLLHCMAGYFFYSGQWNEAKTSASQCLGIRQRILSEDHHDTITIMSNLALIYQHQGQWEDAVKLGLQAMEMQKRVAGEEHPDTLTMMGNLVLAYVDHGYYKKAEELGIKAMEGKKRVLGEEHPDTLISIDNLALAYIDQGKWEKAEELGINKVVEVSKRVLGEDHPDTLTSMNNLASIYENQHEWEKAEELGIKVLEVRERVLGEDHPHTLLSMHNLAVTYMQQGSWERAEKLGIKAVEGRERVLGEDHPHTLLSMHKLATTYGEQGNWERAEELGIKALEGRKRVLGKDHPDTLLSMEYALIYRNQGK